MAGARAASEESATEVAVPDRAPPGTQGRYRAVYEDGESDARARPSASPAVSQRLVSAFRAEAGPRSVPGALAADTRPPRGERTTGVPTDQVVDLGYVCAKQCSAFMNGRKNTIPSVPRSHWSHSCSGCSRRVTRDNRVMRPVGRQARPLPPGGPSTHGARRPDMVLTPCPTSRRLPAPAWRAGLVGSVRWCS
jgi:hypothetical protein